MVTDRKLFLKTVSEELSDSLTGIDQTQLDDLVKLIVSGKRVFTAGAGQAALMMKVLAMMLMQAGFSAYVVGDATTPSIQEGDVLIAASYSGTTKTTLHFISQAKARNVKVGLFTANKNSEAAKLADAVVVIHSASDENSKKPTVLYEGDGFVQTLMPLAHCVARFAGEAIGATEAVMIHNHANLQ